MIDWINAEIYAICAGERTIDAVQSLEGRALIKDIANNFRAYSGRGEAKEETWLMYGRGLKVLGAEFCHRNGTILIQNRMAKEAKRRELVEQVNRLINPEDPCIDLVGDGSRSSMLDHNGLIERMKARMDRNIRFKCRFPAINHMLADWSAGDVVILCGKSGTGKTNVAMQLTYFSGYNVLYFGVDMTTGAFAERLWKTAWYRDNQNIFDDPRDDCNKSAFKAIKDGSAEIAPGIMAYDCDRMTLEQIEINAKAEMARFKADILVIDYAGRIESDKTAKDQWRVDQEIARSVKGMAKRLGVRVMALAQFNGNSEHGKKPQDGWLQGSKEFISASDTVLCVWCDLKQATPGQPQEIDRSHVWLSDDIKNRDAGCHGNVKLDAYGLWLTEAE
jgi:ABC-type dipeptide/oligopeptide/nickel transport system ATPase subunit